MRRQKNRGRPVFIRRPSYPPIKEPETEKEIKERIAELEYMRIKLPKFPSLRVTLRLESLTNEINRLYKKLEGLKKDGK